MFFNDIIWKRDEKVAGNLAYEREREKRDQNKESQTYAEMRKNNDVRFDRQLFMCAMEKDSRTSL